MKEKKGKGEIRKGLSKAGAWIHNHSKVVIVLTAIGGLALGFYNIWFPKDWNPIIKKHFEIAAHAVKPNIKMYYAVSKIPNFRQEFEEHLKGRCYYLMINPYYNKLRDIGQEERLLWLVFENKGTGYAEKIYISHIAYHFGNEPPRLIVPPPPGDPRPNQRYGEIPNRVLEPKGIAVLLVEILKFEPEYVNKQPGFINYLKKTGFFETFKANISLHDILTGSPKSEPVKTSMHEWSDAWPGLEQYMKK